VRATGLLNWVNAVTKGESYFSDCERDDKGYCLSEGEAGSGGARAASGPVSVSGHFSPEDVDYFRKAFSDTSLRTKIEIVELAGPETLGRTSKGIKVDLKEGPVPGGGRVHILNGKRVAVLPGYTVAFNPVAMARADAIFSSQRGEYATSNLTPRQHIIEHELGHVLQYEAGIGSKKQYSPAPPTARKISGRAESSPPLLPSRRANPTSPIASVTTRGIACRRDNRGTRVMWGWWEIGPTTTDIGGS
jgi:hypothetical protein